MSARRPYRRPVSFFWWLQNKAHFFYMLREFSALFLLLFSILMLLTFFYLQSMFEYTGWLIILKSPWMMLLGVLMFLMSLLHTITFALLLPMAKSFYLGSKPGSIRKLPNIWVSSAFLLLSLLVNLGVLYFVIQI